jgi:hypothetical protein
VENRLLKAAALLDLSILNFSIMPGPPTPTSLRVKLRRVERLLRNPSRAGRRGKQRAERGRQK